MNWIMREADEGLFWASWIHSSIFSGVNTGFLPLLAPKHCLIKPERKDEFQALYYTGDRILAQTFYYPAYGYTRVNDKAPHFQNPQGFGSEGPWYSTR